METASLKYAESKVRNDQTDFSPAAQFIAELCVRVAVACLQQSFRYYS